MRFRPIAALLRFFAAGILVLGVAFGCSPDERQPRHLIIGISGSLNLGAANPVMIQRNGNVWETLTDLDDSLTPRPALAESWDVLPDAKTWRFHLRKGVRFHDGALLTAGLVERNITRLREHPELDYYSVYTDLDTVLVLDDATIECRFTRPVVDLPCKVGHYFAGIFSPAAFGPDGKLTAPIGSGPYIFVESAISQYDRVRAFEDYHGGRPHFDTIEFRIIPDPTVRIMSLIRGDIDMIAHHGGVPAGQLSLLRGKPGITIDSLTVGITHYLLFNCGRPPFSDKRARGAFDRLLNRDELVTRILAGAGVPAHDFFVETAATWDARRFSTLPLDVESSPGMALLRSAGPLSLVVAQGDVASWGYRRVSDYLVDYFKRLGIDITVTVLEGGAWSEATKAGTYDITLYPLSIPTGTPELFIRRLAFSAGMQYRTGGNTTQYSSAELDSLFLAAREAASMEEHIRRYNTLLDILAADKPVLPLFHERYFFAYRSDLGPVHVDPFLKIDLGALSSTQR